MKFSEIKNALEHLTKTTSCSQCQSKYKLNDIHVIATTQVEGLFEMDCPSCSSGTIVSVFLTPEVEIRNYRPIKNGERVSKNDILDVKNFLNSFDGNFKKIFTKD